MHSTKYLYILGDRWRTGDAQGAFFIKLQFAGGHPVNSLYKVVDWRLIFFVCVCVTGGPSQV